MVVSILDYSSWELQPPGDVRSWSRTSRGPGRAARTEGLGLTGFRGFRGLRD